jgi:hypothetical protein
MIKKNIFFPAAPITAELIDEGRRAHNFVVDPVSSPCMKLYMVVKKQEGKSETPVL